MVLLILTRQGYEDIESLISSVSPKLWVNHGVLTAAELSSLRASGLDVTNFTDVVALTESSIARALRTIAEHHPTSSIWVESVVHRYDLDRIVSVLDRYMQRATYGAVAGLLGVHPRSLMQGRDRSFVNSWVVSADSHLPTGYAPEEMHPRLAANPEILSTPLDLDAWLRART